MSAADPDGEPPPLGAGRGDASTEHVGDGAARATTDVPMRSLDGVPVERLRAELRVPELHLLASTTSTLDVAHRLGTTAAPHGTLVVADQQTQGRGRAGKTWSSPPGTGLWITILARPTSVTVPPVVTVRLGLAAAKVLDRFASARVQIRWPNDLFLGDRKLAGVLVEARWRGTSPEWLAIGIGINVTGSAHTSRGASLGANTSRVDVLRALMPGVRAAIDRSDTLLDAGEIADYESRDLVRGKACVGPVAGIVRGIGPNAELIIATAAGPVAVSSGSLTLAEDA